MLLGSGFQMIYIILLLFNTVIFSSVQLQIQLDMTPKTIRYILDTFYPIACQC